MHKGNRANSQLHWIRFLRLYDSHELLKYVKKLPYSHILNCIRGTALQVDIVLVVEFKVSQWFEETVDMDPETWFLLTVQSYQ